jgi:hypothetical protein
MPDVVSLTPGKVTEFLSEMDHDAFVAFVTDLYEQEGYETDQRGSVLTATAPDGDHERILVWTDTRSQLDRLLGRDPPIPDTTEIDTLVTRETDTATGTLVAEELDARVLDPDDLHDRLLYAIDREASRALCKDHFGRDVELRPGRDRQSDTTESEPLGVLVSPRGLLVALALFGVGVIVGAGLSGVVPLDGSLGSGAPPMNSTAPTPTDISTVETPPPSSETQPPLCEDCQSSLRLELPEAPSLFYRESHVVTAGEPTIVTGQVGYGYLENRTEQRTLTNVTINAPSGWRITRLDADQTEPIRLSQTPQQLSWGVTVPESAEGGRYNLTVTSTYQIQNTSEASEDTTPEVFRVRRNYTMPVKPADCFEPCGLLSADRNGTRDFGGVHITNVSQTVTGYLYNPYPYPLRDGQIQMDFGENYTITDTNGTTFETLSPGASQRVSWNLTLKGKARRVLGNGSGIFIGWAGHVTYERSNRTRVTVPLSRPAVVVTTVASTGESTENSRDVACGDGPTCSGQTAILP